MLAQCFCSCVELCSRYTGRSKERSNEGHVLQRSVNYSIVPQVFCERFSWLRYHLANKLGLSNHYHIVIFKYNDVNIALS